MEEENTEKRVFISYSRKDASKMRRLTEELVEDGLDVHMDLDAIQAGESFQESLVDAIRESNVVVCLMSPSYPESAWCKTEWESAFKLRKSIIPVLLENSEVQAPLSLLNYLDLKDMETESGIMGSSVFNYNQ